MQNTPGEKDRFNSAVKAGKKREKKDAVPNEDRSHDLEIARPMAGSYADRYETRAITNYAIQTTLDHFTK